MGNSAGIGGNRKRSKQSTKADQKLLETVLLIAICRQLGDKWQLKTLFLAIFDLRSSIVLTFSIAAYQCGAVLDKITHLLLVKYPFRGYHYRIGLNQSGKSGETGERNQILGVRKAHYA